ncbi:MAG: hypothetical protein H7831_04790 [Magnetococcus sp. WYHC-3]
MGPTLHRSLSRLLAAMGVGCLLPASPAWAQTLQEAIIEAIQTHPEVRMTVSNPRALELEIQEAFSSYLPHLKPEQIQLERGDMVNWFWIDGVMEEMYDMVIVPSLDIKMALGFRSDRLRQLLESEETRTE